MVNNQSYVMCCVMWFPGSLSNDDADVNENGKKTVGLDFQNNRYSLLEFISRKKNAKHLTNWARWNKRD